MAMEWDGYATAQVWRPVSYPGLVLYRVSGRASSQALHVHDELQLTLDAGHLQEVSCGGSRLTAPPGSLVVIPPGEVHALRAEGGRPGVLCGMLVPTGFLTLGARPVPDGDEGAPREEPLLGGGAVLDDPDVARDFVALHRALRVPGPVVEPRFWALLSVLLSRLGVGRAALRPEGEAHQATP
ncbi:AraC family ligand binding domain-containing protein [Myxococcus landrumensis]|uniref:AraC family ligand binding domain-containing protein n=1 Tax=Myxococcus landrumensis TaxID=2813577 RepID=A0ABX7NDE2_9BACT|nr:AraC family ligand binding domain-containing protein [Myxococcus landrumus]QSQ16408.1 AraC family ligand binding domain-containing protein [Myxococcus landrumus]